MWYLFMTLHIIVTKPYDFQGDVVACEEVTHSKFFKLSDVWEKRKYFSFQYSQFGEKHCLDSKASPAGPSDRSDEYGTLVELCWQENESSWRRTNAILSTKILQWLIQGQTWICMMRGWQLSAWAMAQLFWSLKFMYTICKHTVPASQKKTTH